MNQIDRAQVERMARLAKMDLSEEETMMLRKDMAEIIAFADQLNALDLGDTPTTTHAVPVKNVYREDICKPSYDRSEILENAPEQDGECYIVPQVVE